MRPAAQLAAGSVLIALLFPASPAGEVALAMLGALAGVGACVAWPHAPEWLKRPDAKLTAAIALTIVAVLGLGTFWEVMTESPDWQMGDWGPQRAVLAKLMPHLPGFHAPMWMHGGSTGDAPFDLYPSLAYFVAGHIAWLFGLQDDLALALMITATLVHVAIAVGTTALAMRIAPKPIAVLVGVAALLDGGAVAHGGTVGLFRWALLHSALSLALALVAACAIIDALRRPRLRITIVIWVFTALACIAHPAGLIGAAASMLALAITALLAGDVPPRRALAALVNVGIGVALGAFAWMPLGTRILQYGEHFPNGLHEPASLIENLLQAPSPVTWFGMLGFAGYFGVLAGLWSRRAAVVYIAAVGLALVVGLCDLPYLALGIAPSKTVARLGVERLVQIARPFLGAAAAYAIAILGRHAVAAWRTATNKRLAAGVLGLCAAVLLRVVPNAWEDLTGRAVAEAHVFAPDPVGRQQLTAWARKLNISADRYARIVFEEDTHEEMHLLAETGVPVFHMGPIPDLMLRERIEDLTAPSLARFDVRWAVGLAGRSPSIGDPNSEVALGQYRIREIPTWDGKFARIEKGEGTVTTTRLDDDAVTIDVHASAPVLVALGTGYYPRWRATHADGRDEPVYALPGIDNGKLHVVAAWVEPGVTTFTCDGPLPSDHDGLLFSILAMLAAVTITIVWATRFRWRVLRQLAIVRIPRVGRFAVPVVLLLLVAKGVLDGRAPMRAVRLGTGVRATATVEARTAGQVWETCGYENLTGHYRCPGLAAVYDATSRVLNDAEPSWGFLAPAIVATHETDGVEIRVRLSGRFTGTYLAASTAVSALELGSDAHEIGAQTTLELTDSSERVLELVAPLDVERYEFAMVRADAIDVAREFPLPPAHR